MLRAIRQRDGYGCAIACLAFLLNKSYQSVVGELGKDKAEKKGFFVGR